MLTFIIVYFVFGLVVTLYFCGEDMANDVKNKKYGIVVLICSLIVSSLIVPVGGVYECIMRIFNQD